MDSTNKKEKRQLQHKFNISETEIHISWMFGVERCYSKQVLSWKNQNKVD